MRNSEGARPVRGPNGWRGRRGPGPLDAFRGLLESEMPDVVFTQWPIDNHRDHRATSTLVYDAWLRSAKPFALYYYEVSDGEDTLLFHPTDYVDITETENRKRAACYAHASQSPIASTHCSRRSHALGESKAAIGRRRHSFATRGVPAIFFPNLR